MNIRSTVSAIVLQGILIWSLLTFTPTDYNGIAYPTWGDALGWCTVSFAVMFIPIFAIVAIIRAKGNLFKVNSNNKKSVYQKQILGVPTLLNQFGYYRSKNC